MCKLTIFTAAYNRAYILPKLYESLCSQTCFNFEWLVVDDGSQDNTVELLEKWKSEEKNFSFRYVQLNHGGKNRAINKAVSLAAGSFFLIVDSDDYLSKDAVEWICSKIPEIENNSKYAGFSGIRCKMGGSYIVEPRFNGTPFIDCLNIERKQFNLHADMAEVYKTEILQRYPFPAIVDETFIPENVVWDAVALDGFFVRWYDKKIYYCEYLDDGITKGWNDLRKKNPIGFAMSANTYLKYAKGVFSKLQLIGEILYCCFLKGDFSFLRKTVYPKICYALIPMGYIYYLMRKHREHI